MPKYEKVDDTTIKVTREISQDINVPKLVTARKQVVEEMELLKTKLEAVDEALQKAEDLGMDITKEHKKVIDESNDNKTPEKA